ncbi:hypothetical protein KAF25_009195 [Fusarium avenaceum]|uniref:Uncharacterized protein n=1 Tax=Fusarium avenaceum TaxID=40199 RepID=A0A9P7KQR4_9HYPO|nr:hypothetical protein KAF25_009195 [Fusarium avenaceum]
MQPEPSSLSCDHCGETFQRREHRDRHVLRHTGLKPFRCHVCSKSFSRNDTLIRHRALHSNDDQPQARSQGRRRGQACISCSKLKQRCDGGQPCARCMLRDSECSYSQPKLSISGTPHADISGRSGSDSDTIMVQPESQSSSILQDPSPLATQRTEATGEDNLAGEFHVASEEWTDHPSIPSDMSSIPTMTSSTLYSSAPAPTTTWYQHQPLAESPYAGDASAFSNLSDSSWMLLDPLMGHFSFPWFMEGLEVPFDLPDFPESQLQAQAEAQADSAISTTSDFQTSAATLAPPQAYLSPSKICSSYTRPCRPFPEPQATSTLMAGAEIFGHIHDIPQKAIQGLSDFYKIQRQDTTQSTIPESILHAFVELYFEFFDPQFPFLHPSRIQDVDLPWILLLAVAAVGSHYSEIQETDEYTLALTDLLSRAVESLVSDKIATVDIATVQSVFLLHVLWMFSGSHRDKIVLRHKQSSLATLCWDLLGEANRHRSSASHHDPGPDQEWKAWVDRESEIRIATCVRGMIGYSIDNAKHRHEQREGVPEQGDSRTPFKEAFTSKIVVLELFIDERNLSRQIRCSQLLRSSFMSYLDHSSNEGAHAAANPYLPTTGTHKSENTLLGTAIDRLAFPPLHDITGGQSETIFHVLAILRLVPLDTLHSATGWQTTGEQKAKSKAHFKDFYINNGEKARKALWHAACIFRSTRSCRRLACYDALSLTVSMGYVYCYSEVRTLLSQTPGTSASAQSPPSIVRLDQLYERSAVEQWVETGADSIVHLTGVGLLDGSDHCVRFLRDLERSLQSQIAWRGFCRAFAGTFAQLRRGETPTRVQLTDLSDTHLSPLQP